MSKKAAAAAGSAKGVILRMARAEREKTLNCNKFSQNAENRQIVLAQIGQTHCVLRERQEMSKKAAVAAGSAKGVILRMARAEREKLLFNCNKFSQNAENGQIVLAQIGQTPCVLRERREMSKKPRQRQEAPKA